MIFGGWGNGWGNGFNSNGVGSEVQRGFDQNAVMNGLSGIHNAITAGFANAETSAANRQMADMNQNFALQSSMQQCLTKIFATIKKIFSSKNVFNNGTCIA